MLISTLNFLEGDEVLDPLKWSVGDRSVIVELVIAVGARNLVLTGFSGFPVSEDLRILITIQGRGLVEGNDCLVGSRGKVR